MTDAHELLAQDVIRNIDFSIFGAEIWLVCERDKNDPQGRLFYQVHAMRPDVYTGQMGEGAGGKAYLSPFAIEDELVQLAWGLLQSYVLHEEREGFLYKGKRIFGPHMKISRLMEIADDTVGRKETRA